MDLSPMKGQRTFANKKIEKCKIVSVTGASLMRGHH